MRNNKLTLYSIACILLFVSVVFAGKIGIIVNKNLYPLIESSINTYIEDVQQIEQKGVWLEATTYDETSSPDDLKNNIKDHYENDELEGVIFIGDLPIVNHEDDNQYHPCDWWWMDLDGVWGGSNYNFNSHTGDREMEIWHSRITTGVHPDLGAEEDIVISYLERVHRRMRGQDDHGRNLCIIGDKASWGGLESENINSLDYPSDKTSTYSGSTCTGANWQSEQESGEMEFGFLYSHSSSTSHSTPSWSYNNQLGIDADGRFYHLFACSNSRYTTKNMGGLYGYGGNGLIGFGSTKTGSMRPGGFAAFNTPLTEGKSFGEAFMEWASTEGIKDHDWNYGMCIQGVGTLRLAPYPGGPYLAISSPDGGEEWEQGNTYDIKWGSNVSGNVKIELLKGGAVDKVIESSTENDGLHSLAITTDYAVGNDYKIKISSLTNDTVICESNENFSITEEYIIKAFPYVQDFDTLNTGTVILPYKWEQLDVDDINWTVWTGKTPTKESDGVTGPDGDHTSGAGNYIYVESSSPNNPDKKADYATPKFNLKALADPELTFWCHMFSDNSGQDEMGDLYLDICVDGNWSSDVVQLSKDHGDAWFEQKVDLNQYKGERVIFRFRAVTGSGWASDICIDDFKIDGLVSVNDLASKVSLSFGLGFYGSRIHFRVPENTGKEKVHISLYNVQGKLVKKIVNDNLKAGYYSVPLRLLATGLYICRMEAEGFNKTINVILTK